jgi:hypothetical protein
MPGQWSLAAHPLHAPCSHAAGELWKLFKHPHPGLLAGFIMLLSTHKHPLLHVEGCLPGRLVSKPQSTTLWEAVFHSSRPSSGGPLCSSFVRPRKRLCGSSLLFLAEAASVPTPPATFCTRSLALGHLLLNNTPQLLVWRPCCAVLTACSRTTMGFG